MIDTDDPIVLRAQLEAAQQEVQRLTVLVGHYEHAPTIPPDGEDTGPVHIDPLAEVYVAIDKFRDEIALVLKGVREQRPEWVDEILSFTQRVVELEEWRRRRDFACADCPRLKALGE